MQACIWMATVSSSPRNSSNDIPITCVLFKKQTQKIQKSRQLNIFKGTLVGELKISESS